MTFPAYWGPKDGPVILARSPVELGAGWVQHYGSYNIQTGQWEPRDPLDRDAKDGAGGSLPRNVPKLKALAKAENIDIGDARKADEIQAIILAARTG